MADNINKIQKLLDINAVKPLALSVLYSLGDKKHDLEATLKIQKDSKSLSDDTYKKLFKDCAFFSTYSVYEKYEENNKVLGNQSGIKWVMPSDQADQLLKGIKELKSEGERHSLYERSIGYGEGATNDEDKFVATYVDGDFIQRIQKLTTNTISMYMPNAKVGGANQFWLPGGMTSGGKFEMIVKGLPNRSPYIKKKLIGSFKTGKSSEITVVDHF